MYCLILPMVTTLCFGYREAAVWNLLTGIGCVLMLFETGLLGATSFSTQGVDFIAAFSVVVFLTLFYERLRSSTHQLAHAKLREEKTRNSRFEAQAHRQFEDLLQAIRDVRELSGLVPICACCKKIRTEEDLWEHLEPFLDKRTRLTFSHGICPSCTDEAMDDLNGTWARRA